MLVKMKSHEFNSHEVTKLGEICFEPIIQVYKTEQSLSNDLTEFYKKLTRGQQALFMFHVYYNHAKKSLIELYWWSAYFMAQPTVWTEIKSGLVYFQDDAMPLFFEEIETVLRSHNHPSSLEGFTVTREDISRNKELLEAINTLTERFQEIAPSTINLIGTYIRHNPDEFVQLED